MKKIAKFGILALFLVSLVAGAFAFSGIGNEDARKALESGDYTAWKEAMVAGLTEDNFNKIHERYQQTSEKRAEMQNKRVVIEAAIEAGDYEAWLSAIEGYPKDGKLTEVITKENFNTFVEMYKTRQNGDIEKAKTLAEELGLNGIGKGFGKGRFGHKMSSE